MGDTNIAGQFVITCHLSEVVQGGAGGHSLRGEDRVRLTSGCVEYSAWQE